MPVKKLWPWQILTALRQYQSGPVMRQHPRGRIVTSVEMLTERNLIRVGQDGERAKIKYLVVQRAQGNAVWHDVRAVGLEPFDVRGFQADDLPAEPQIVTTDAAAVLVGQQHFFAEHGISPANIAWVTC